MNQNEKEAKVYQVFETIAPGYDDANRRISLGMQDKWKKHLVDAAFACGGSRALDVCCGTGDIAIALAEKFEVTGLDFSPAMLEVAKKRAPELNFIQGSAMELPFEDESFDVATVSFGLRNTADYSKVLSEMKRVIKKGGRIFVLDSFEPRRGFVYPFYKFYFSKIMPLLGGKQEEYQWLNKSTEDFLSPEELAQLIKKAGLTEVSLDRYFFGTCCLLQGVR